MSSEHVRVKRYVRIERKRKEKIPGRLIAKASELFSRVTGIERNFAERIIRWRANRNLPIFPTRVVG